MKSVIYKRKNKKKFATYSRKLRLNAYLYEAIEQQLQANSRNDQHSKEFENIYQTHKS